MRIAESTVTVGNNKIAVFKSKNGTLRQIVSNIESSQVAKMIEAEEGYIDQECIDHARTLG